MKKNKKGASFFLRLLVILSFPFIVCLIYLLLIVFAPDEKIAKEYQTYNEYERIQLPFVTEALETTGMGGLLFPEVMETDGKGGFWFAGKSDLYHCKKVHDTCEHKKFTGILITDIAYDLNANKLWIGTYNDGVMIGQGNSFEQINPKESEKTIDEITKIDIDNYGQAWIGTKNGVYISKFGSELEIMEININILRKEISEISVDTTGSTWAGTTDGDIFIINQYINNFEVSNSYSLTEEIVEIVFDNDGRAWVGTLKDIYIFDADLNLLNHNHFDFMEPEFQTIQAIKFDSLGRAWIGLNRGFAIVQNNTPYLFKREITDFSPPEVKVIETDAQGNVWMLEGMTIFRVQENLTLPLPYKEAMVAIENQNTKIENFTFLSKDIQDMFPPLAIIWASLCVSLFRKDSTKKLALTENISNTAGTWIFWFFIGGTVHFCFLLMLILILLHRYIIPSINPSGNPNIVDEYIILTPFISGLSYWVLGGNLPQDDKLKRIWPKRILILFSLVFWILPYLLFFVISFRVI